MKKISDCLSPMNWAFIYLTSIFSISVLLRPTLFEYLFMVAIDVASFFIFILPLEKLFFYIFPKYCDVFDSNYCVAPEQFEGLSSEKIKHKVSIIISLPRDRAKILFFGSWLKCVPTLIFLVFFMQSARPAWQNFILTIIIFLNTFMFFTGVGYFEAHKLLSSKLQDLIKKTNFFESILNLNIQPAKNEVQFVERLSLYILFLSTLCLQCFLLITAGDQLNDRIKFEQLIAAAIGYSLFFRFRHVSQEFFLGGLFKIFDSIDQISQMKYDFYVPLHTHGVLAKFELSMNQLLKKIRAGDRETTYWMLAMAEKERFKGVGEISAYIIHDLSGPFNVIKFIFQKLSQDPLLLTKNNNYLSVMNDNLAKIFELTDSLRAKLKNKSCTRNSSIAEVHQNTVKLLETQFYGQGFSRLSIDFDDQLNSFDVAVNSVDLGQIFDNIYRNSIENILKNDQRGRVGTKFISRNSTHIEFLVSDDCAGISLSEFKDLISFRFDSKGVEYRSLGLKLTHRLIETYGGAITVTDTPIYGSGTSFLISLPIFNSQNKGVTHV